MSILALFRKNSPLPKNTRTTPGAIGLDIGANRIHLCQLRPLPAGCYAIVAKLSVDFSGSRQDLLASPGDLKKILNQALKEKAFKGRKVIALMPLEEVKIILLTYKANVIDVDAEIVKMVRNRIDDDIENYVVDYLSVRSNPSDEEHMAVVSVAKRARVDALLQCLTYCGLEVVSLDIAPAALRRIVSTLYTGKSADNVLLINTDAEVSYLTIISGRRLLFDQAVDFGVNRLLDTIAKSLDMNPSEARKLVQQYGLEASTRGPFKSPAGSAGEDVAATLLEIVKPLFLDLIEEINRVLIFTSAETHGVPVSRVCLLGSIAHWRGAQQLLLSLMDINIPDDQVEFWQIYQDESDQTTIPWSGLFPDLAIATGLALRGIGGNEGN